MKSVYQLWFRLSSSLWFVPALVVAVSLGTAMALVDMQTYLGDRLAEDWPRLFGAGADGSRAMLSSIATSMATVAGVVFSITMVTLSLSATQYSPRILRNFMRDRTTQLVLGIFMGIFAYCLVVLRTVRAADDLEFIPSLAVITGMAYALAGIGFLIYFIHHVAQSIQASNIAARIHEETASIIDRLYPDCLGHAAPLKAPASQPDPLPGQPVAADHSGYVTTVDADRVLSLAIETVRVLRLRVRIGEFVAEGGTLASFDGHQPVGEAIASRLRESIALDRQRTEQQDVGFGLQQLVDIAVKALSPGINDPTTACLCIDRLGALLRRLASREFPSSLRSHRGQLAVVAPAPDFAELARLVLEPVIVHSRGDLQVADRLLDAIASIGAATHDDGRRRALADAVRELEATLAGASPRQAYRRRRIRARRLRGELERR